jgi:hypothetical protein
MYHLPSQICPKSRKCDNPKTKMYVTKKGQTKSRDKAGLDKRCRFQIMLFDMALMPFLKDVA